MKKLLFAIFILFSTFADAKNINVNYGVSFGVLGELGLANVKLTESGNRYTIDIHAKTTGIVKVMSQNRTERHISEGHIVNGKYISDSYKVFISFGNKTKEKIYTIDHKTKTVTKHIIRKKDSKVIIDKIEKLPFYSQNDLLSLYMNTPKLISEYSGEAKVYRYKAIGAENQDGSVEIRVPSSSEIARYKKELGVGYKHYFKAIINQPIFASKRGEFMISMDNNGVTHKAILQDLLLFGDLVAIKK
jgi:hypothetical protein